MFDIMVYCNPGLRRLRIVPRPPGHNLPLSIGTNGQYYNVGETLHEAIEFGAKEAESIQLTYPSETITLVVPSISHCYGVLNNDIGELTKWLVAHFIASNDIHLRSLGLSLNDKLGSVSDAKSIQILISAGLTNSGQAWADFNNTLAGFVMKKKS